MEHRAVVALDVDAESFADGANIQQCTGNGTAAQRVAIEPADPSDPIVYKLVNQTIGKCADIQDWSLPHRCMHRGGGRRPSPPYDCHRNGDVYLNSMSPARANSN